MFYSDFNASEKMVVRKVGLVFFLLLNVFAIALIASYGFSAWKDARGIFGTDAKLEIAVSGQGKVSAKPDVAKITATIMTQRESVKDAQDENAKRSNAVVGYLKQQGVADKDIKTVGYNIFPQYSYPQPCTSTVCPVSDVPRVVGYQVRNSVEITIRDLTKASDILAGVVQSGVNEVSGLTFTIDQPDELQAQARAKAIADADKKAQELARELGRRVGKVVNYSEGGMMPQPLFADTGVAYGKGGGGVAPAIETGENEISVNVSITYEFR